MNGIRYLQKKSSQTCTLLSIPEIIFKKVWVWISGGGGGGGGGSSGGGGGGGGSSSSSSVTILNYMPIPISRNLSKIFQI